jgi:hypothetical protein
LSRHRKVRLSRSKAIVIAAAGALSVATAASAAAAATWSPGTQEHAAGSDGPAEIAHEAAGAPRLTVTDQLARPITAAADEQSSATLAQHALELRLTQTRDAIAQRQAAKKRAAELAAKKAAAAAAARHAARARARAAVQPSRAVSAASGSPQHVAEAMLGSFGWSSGQFSCLNPLWEHESGWSVTAANPGSGAYGIPQALPGSRMASAGPDWQTNAATQIKWGLTYIKDTYGSPCAAWAHSQATGWY